MIGLLHAQYNLQLIEDRDGELERYDAAFANLKNVLRDRDAEASDLKVSIDEHEAQVCMSRMMCMYVRMYLCVYTYVSLSFFFSH